MSGEAMIVAPDPRAKLTAIEVFWACGKAMHAAATAYAVQSAAGATPPNSPGGDCIALVPMEGPIDQPCPRPDLAASRIAWS